MAISKELKDIKEKNKKNLDLSVEEKNKLRDICENPAKYKKEKVKNAVIKSGGALKNEENIWFVADKTDSYINVHRMPPLLFALRELNPNMALSLLKSKKYGDFSKMSPVKVYDLCGLKTDYDGLSFDDLDEFFSNTEGGFEKSLSRQMEEKEIISDDMYLRGCVTFEPMELIMENYLGERISKELCYLVLKEYAKTCEDGWFEFEKGLQLVFEHEGSIFNTYNPNVVSDVFSLLVHIRKQDEKMYRKMMSPKMFYRLILTGSELREDTEQVKELLKKLYCSDYSDTKDFWDIFLKMNLEESGNEFMWEPGGCKQDGALMKSLWHTLTGKKLVFPVNEIELGHVKIPKHYNFRPPFGLGNTSVFSNNSDYVEGKYSGHLLNVIIRSSDCVLYTKNDRESLFDLDYILSQGSEDLVLMALKKDFIRKEDLDYCFDCLKEQKKKGLMPAFVLKRNGEWPEFDETDLTKSVRRNRQKV